MDHPDGSKGEKGGGGTAVPSWLSSVLAPSGLFAASSVRSASSWAAEGPSPAALGLLQRRSRTPAGIVRRRSPRLMICSPFARLSIVASDRRFSALLVASRGLSAALPRSSSQRGLDAADFCSGESLIIGSVQDFLGPRSFWSSADSAGLLEALVGLRHSLWGDETR